MTDIDLEAEVAKHAEISRRATELVQRDPALSYISAIIIAGDMMQADRALDHLRDGSWDWRKAEAMTGSYGRLDLRLRAFDEGLITEFDLYSGLPDIWSGSDPDDTDPRMLDLWRGAWELNGRRVLRQPRATRALPRKSRLTVYRGQDLISGPRPAAFGISWSLDRHVAAKFAIGAATRQHNRWGVVYRATVHRESILGWMPNRGEAEVIIDPARLLDIDVDHAPTPAGVPT